MMKQSGSKNSNSSVLPEDDPLLPEIWMDIFARLPVKTLLQTRCVSKSWYSIINSSEFTYIHLNRYKNNCDKTHVLVKGGFGKRCKFNLHKTQDFSKIGGLFHLTRDSYALIGSCNGLLLMRDTSSKEAGNTVRLWNPSIRRSLLLPRLPYNYRHYVVMGFAPISNDYKVVAFEYVCSVLSYAVFSLYDRRWRVEAMTNVTRPVRVSRLLGGGGYVYLQGVAYWIGDRPEQLVCFDFDLEEFSFIELPDEGGEVSARIVFLLNESLAILSVSSETSCVWVMEIDAGRKVTWRVCFSGDCNLEASNLIKECTCNKSVVIYVKNTDMILVVLSGKAYFYNIRNQELKECEKTVRDLDSVCTYVESLVLH